MFNLEIEQKIIDFIKKGPLGVTSSEIASYIGLNRVTMTKYLAVIKEKTLIDFKQFGMAKLWYIPVSLNKESFLTQVTEEISKNLPEAEFKSISEKLGINLGESINTMYLNFNGAVKLTIGQLSDAYADIGKKLGGNFKPRLMPDRISVEILQQPFDQGSMKFMNRLISAIFAKMAALNMGYGRSIVSEPNEKGNISIDIYLKKEESSPQGIVS